MPVFVLKSINTPFLYDIDNDVKSIGQTIVRMSNLSSLNCFDTHGNGQTDPVIFTCHTHTSQQRVWTTTANRIYQNYELPSVFYNPYPEILYNFPISSNFLNNRYLDFTFIMQFVGSRSSQARRG